MTVQDINVSRFAPETDEELHDVMEKLWGVRIPTQGCCPEHTAPMTVIANAYFDREAVQVWKASRGFGGKSWALALLTATEAIYRGAQATILGGSAAQSRNVQEVNDEAFMSERAPKGILAAEPTRFQTVLLNGAWIRALMASQRSVRGPHPQRLRMDEIDEMELAILEAALGQPMSKMRNGQMVQANTILSSTHQYPDGTMTEMLKRAAEMGWAVHHWCYRCNLVSNGGWLSQREVNAKRMLVPKAMWDAEYELQEPSFEGRAMDTEAVQRMFSLKPKAPGDSGKEYIFTKPEPGRHYVTGTDWAKKQDWTVITTYDATESPWKMVAFLRVNRESWQSILGRWRRRLEMYRGDSAHDATGIGNVVGDFLEEYEIPNTTITGVVMTPSIRTELFADYVAAVESDAFRAPNVAFAESEHRYCRMDDLFGTATQGHPPDSVVSGALCWSLRSRHGDLVAPDFEDLEQPNYWSDLW